jgi:hypothetical protein
MQYASLTTHNTDPDGSNAETTSLTTRTDAITLYDTTGRLLAGLGSGTRRQHMGGGLVLETTHRGTPVPGKLTTLTLFRGDQFLGLDVRAGLWSGPVAGGLFDLGFTLGATLYNVSPKDAGGGGTWIGLPFSVETSREVIPMLRLGLRAEWDPMSLANFGVDYGIGAKAIFAPFRWLNVFADAQHYHHRYLLRGDLRAFAGTVGIALLIP